jgi:hypothetical protein
VAEQESEAESLVENARKGMRRVEGYRGEERIDLLLEKFDGEFAVGLAELLPLQHADASALEFGDEAVIPAGTLILVELMEALTDMLQALFLSKSTWIEGLGQTKALFKLLEDAGDADLNELVEVAGGDGEELYALEEWVGGVVGLFEDAAIELEPALVATDVTTAEGCYRRLCGAPGRGSTSGLDRRGLFPDSHAS